MAVVTVFVLVFFDFSSAACPGDADAKADDGMELPLNRLTAAPSTCVALERRTYHCYVTLERECYYIIIL